MLLYYLYKALPAAENLSKLLSLRSWQSGNLNRHMHNACARMVAIDEQ